MQTPRAVLWDLDGTIVDSREFHWSAWIETLAPLGVQVTREQFLTTFGQTNATFLPAWLGGLASPERVRAIGDAKESAFRRAILTAGLNPLPGAAEWIMRLHRQGWRQAIGSSAPRANVEAMLTAVGLLPYFEAVVAAEDVAVGKPDPQVFLKAAEKLSVPAARCIVVEDAAAGIQAARRACMPSVGVGGDGTLEATLTIRSLAELAPDTLERLLGGNGNSAQTRTPVPD